MSESTTRLALPIMLPAQAQKHVTHNEALEKLDLVVQLALVSFDAVTPPADPQEGQIWALGADPLGVWAGQDGRLAAYTRNGWEFLTPSAGWIGYAGSTLRVYDGADWVFPELAALQNLSGLGIRTSFDAINRLAVAAEATLLSHDGAGHQLKINKSGASDTASLLFQTAWSGRAEMGIAGDDDFAIKVSPDGMNWHIAAQADCATGHLEIPNGAMLNGPLTGSAVMQSATDGMAGRVAVVHGAGGIFGLGATDSLFSSSMNLNTDFRERNYYGVQTITASNEGYPSGFSSNNAALSVLRRSAGNRGVQILWGLGHASAGSNAGLAMRIFRNEGTDANWQSFFNTHNLLGAVSQSGGVPTGAALQGNASAASPTGGYAERMAGGFQALHHTLTSSDSTDTTWAYNSAFLSGSTPVVSIQPIGDSDLRVRLVSRSATACVFSIRDGADNRVAVAVDLLARGRWSNMA